MNSMESLESLALESVVVEYAHLLENRAEMRRYLLMENKGISMREIRSTALKFQKILSGYMSGKLSEYRASAAALECVYSYMKKFEYQLTGDKVSCMKEADSITENGRTILTVTAGKNRNCEKVMQAVLLCRNPLGIYEIEFKGHTGIENAVALFDIIAAVYGRDTECLTADGRKAKAVLDIMTYINTEYVRQKDTDGLSIPIIGEGHMYQTMYNRSVHVRTEFSTERISFEVSGCTGGVYIGTENNDISIYRDGSMQKVDARHWNSSIDHDKFIKEVIGIKGNIIHCDFGTGERNAAWG